MKISHEWRAKLVCGASGAAGSSDTRCGRSKEELITRSSTGLWNVVGPRGSNSGLTLFPSDCRRGRKLPASRHERRRRSNMFSQKLQQLKPCSAVVCFLINNEKLAEALDTQRSAEQRQNSGCFPFKQSSVPSSDNQIISVIIELILTNYSELLYY